MSQARVTDFFPHSKKGTVAPAKSAPQHRGASRTSTRSKSSKNKDAFLCPSSVREEFVRVIDEVVRLNDGQSAASNTAKQHPCSPRTPKRTSADAALQAEAAATSGHSAAKKRRQTEAAGQTTTSVSDKGQKRSARKKLILPEETAQVMMILFCSNHGSEMIRKVAKESTSSSSSASVSTALKLTVAHAKELAAKAQRRREERETQEGKQTETQTQDSTEQPAYQRYHTLAQGALPGLSLPYQYKLLAEMFRSMDTVVAMLHNRRETPTFTKIKQGVQDMMHKRFEESHMGQIKTVFPEAYSFRQEKNIPSFNSSIKKGSYQLTVEPIIPSGQNEAEHVLSASRLLERKQIFHQNLISIVKHHHKAFLSSLVPPVSVPEDKLTRWHPRFNVDTVPAVQTSPLPQVPHTDKLVTAQEVLDKACSFITPKMEKALVSLALKTEDKATESNEPKLPQQPAAIQISNPSNAPAAQVPVALKGVSQSLLDRIRAKEAQKLQAVMTRNPIQEERLLMMSRLGELARILRNVFVAEKKAALIMEVACNRMVASYRSTLSTGEMEKHIRLLAEVAADWLTIHPIRKDFYLKLNKNMELSIVLDKLSRRLREEERL
uniref:Chromatin licensing and DNA replication factor 1 n=1 Tax=Amphiprion percula TaxID=161767 RepID=A0A3P8RWS0_AMPPE